ncbi:MAG: hypothetical protein AAF125_09280 [Chloroflexota bacterium]
MPESKTIREVELRGNDAHRPATLFFSEANTLPPWDITHHISRRANRSVPLSPGSLSIRIGLPFSKNEYIFMAAELLEGPHGEFRLQIGGFFPFPSGISDFVYATALNALNREAHLPPGTLQFTAAMISLPDPEPDIKQAVQCITKIAITEDALRLPDESIRAAFDSD